MADPNDPPSQPGARNPDTLGADAEIVDAEVVDESPTPDPGSGGTQGRTTPHSPPGGDDSESFRQYRQFLEFQKFQEWQRLHGDGDATAPPGPSWNAPAKRPWWKRALRLLRFKFVRRLLYLALTLLVLYVFLSELGRDSGDEGGKSTHAPVGGSGSSRAAVLWDTPSGTVRAVYDSIAGNDPEVACALFSRTGKQAFAEAYGTPDCVRAAQMLNAQVADKYQYKAPGIGKSAVKIFRSDASVSSCSMTVNGGPRLGKFGLTHVPGGWVIDNYKLQPACTP